MTEHAIRSLLEEAGERRLGRSSTSRRSDCAHGSPRDVRRAARAERWLQRPRPASATTGVTSRLYRDHFALAGRWRVDQESATAFAARWSGRITSRSVYLVLSSRSDRARRLEVAVDGRRYGHVTVRGQRLYRLLTLPRRARTV